MARNATPNETALRNALAQLAAVKEDPQLTKGRRIVRIDDQMTVTRLPIGKFLTFIRDVKPIVVQRNDLYRLNNGLAKHLETLELPQSILAVVYFEGCFYLVDGNTRKRSWLNQPCRELPSHVFLTVMVVESLEHGKRVYGCYDSKGAKKTNRDELVSMLHLCGVDPSTLNDKLVAGGKLVTVVQAMARAMSGGSASPKRKQEVVSLHSQSFVKLSTLKLDEGEIRGGAAWALLRLYREVPATYTRYVDDYARELRKLTTNEAYLVSKVVKTIEQDAIQECYDAQLGTSGSAPIPVMFPVYLEGFAKFARYLVRAGQADAKFDAFIKKLTKDVIGPDVVRALALQARKAAKV